MVLVRFFPCVCARTALDETDVKGAFKRVNSVWRNHIEEGGQFSPASGRNLAVFSNLRTREE